MMNFVHVDNGDTFRTGEIIESIAFRYFLVRFDDMSGNGFQMGAEMIHIHEMSVTLPDGYRSWSFFPTAEDRQTWIDFINVPRDSSKLRVVSINEQTTAVDI